MLDPSGLFERVPELVPLARRHEALADAVATGDPHEAWHTLRRLRPALRGDDADVVDMLLAGRSYFLRPLGQPLSLHTVAGCGTALRGRDDDDPGAGTFVATRWVVLLGLPLLPLAQYLVSEAPGGEARVYGEVPTPARRALRPAFDGLVLLVLLAAVVGGVERLRAATVSVVNGLPLPVRVGVGVVEVVVPPGARREVVVPSGPHDYVARLDTEVGGGPVVDASVVDVGAMVDVVVINVLGAAPVFAATTRGAELPEPRPGTRLGCGATLLGFDEVDDAWPAPGSATEGRQGVRSVVALAPGGVAACVALLQSRGEAGRAAELARRVAGALPPSPNLLVAAAAATEAAEGPTAALAWLLPHADAYPLDESLQLATFELQQALGLRGEAASRFDQLRQAHPDSPLLARLHAASLEGEPAIDRAYAAALSRFPADSALALAWGQHLLATGRWAPAVEALARAASLGPDVATAGLLGRVTALLGAGRGGDAMALLDAQPGAWTTEAELVRLYAAAARQRPGDTDAVSRADTHLLARVGADRLVVERLHLYGTLGLPASREALAAVDAEGDRRRLLVASRLVDDPVGALSAVALLDDGQVLQLHAAQWILLRGEAMRAGDTDLQVRLDANAPLPAAQARWVREFVGGRAPLGALAPLSPEARAAALVSRARQPATPAAEAWLLRRQALAADPVGGLVARVAARWP